MRTSGSIKAAKTSTGYIYRGFKIDRFKDDNRWGRPCRTWSWAILPLNPRDPDWVSWMNGGTRNPFETDTKKHAMKVIDALRDHGANAANIVDAWGEFTPAEYRRDVNELTAERDRLRKVSPLERSRREPVEGGA